MASRPPLGIALSDQLGVPQPHYSKGQIIAGILADALAGAAGQPGPMAARWNQERQQQNEDVRWGRRLQMTQAMQSPYRFEDNAGNVWERGPDGQNKQIFHDPTPKYVPDGLGGLQRIPGTGDQPSAAPPPGVTFTPIPDGGPTLPASVNFPKSYPNIGPYKRY